MQTALVYSSFQGENGKNPERDRQASNLIRAHMAPSTRAQITNAPMIGAQSLSARVEMESELDHGYTTIITPWVEGAVL